VCHGRATDDVARWRDQRKKRVSRHGHMGRLRDIACRADAKRDGASLLPDGKLRTPRTSDVARRPPEKRLRQNALRNRE